MISYVVRDTDDQTRSIFTETNKKAHLYTNEYDEAPGVSNVLLHF